MTNYELKIEKGLSNIVQPVLQQPNELQGCFVLLAARDRLAHAAAHVHNIHHMVINQPNCQKINFFYE